MRETTKEERERELCACDTALRDRDINAGVLALYEVLGRALRDVDTLEAALLDARERIDRWDQLWLGILYGAVYDLAGAKESANAARREVDCKHEWGPLPEWDNEYEPWEHCVNCKVNRPARAALAPPSS
jgi:hypothetical protein